MFKETDMNTQSDMFFAPDSMLNGIPLTLYQEKSSGYNVFRKDILMCLVQK